MLPAFAAGTAGQRPSLLPNLQAAGTSVMLHCVCVPQWGKDHQLVKQSMHRARLSHHRLPCPRAYGQRGICLPNLVLQPFLQDGAAGWEDSSTFGSCGSNHVTVVPKILHLDISVIQTA